MRVLPCNVQTVLRRFVKEDGPSEVGNGAVSLVEAPLGRDRGTGEK